MELQQNGSLEGQALSTVHRAPRRVAGMVGIVSLIGLTLGVSGAVAGGPASVPVSPASATIVAEAVTPGGGAGEPTADPEVIETAFTEYAACMRAHGIDMPDPVVVQAPESGATGGAISVTGSVSEAAPLSELDSTAFEAANDACSPILEAAGIAAAPTTVAGPDGDRLDIAGAGGGAIGGAAVLGGSAAGEDLEAMVAPIRTYAACMREHGVDVPDPVVDEAAGTFEMRFDVDPSSSEFRAAESACADGSFGIPVLVEPTTP